MEEEFTLIKEEKFLDFINLSYFVTARSLLMLNVLRAYACLQSGGKMRSIVKKRHRSSGCLGCQSCRTDAGLESLRDSSSFGE